MRWSRHPVMCDDYECRFGRKQPALFTVAGDIHFANHITTILRRFNIPPTVEDLTLDERATMYMEKELPFMDAFRGISFDDLDHLSETVVINHLSHHMDYSEQAEKMGCSKDTARTFVNLWMIIMQFKTTQINTSKLATNFLNHFDSDDIWSAHAGLDELSKPRTQSDWNWNIASRNRNITKEFYLANQDKKWHIHTLSVNLSLDFDFACQLSNYAVFRMDVTWDFLLENLDSVRNDWVQYHIIDIPACIRAPFRIPDNWTLTDSLRWNIFCRKVKKYADWNFDPKVDVLPRTWKNSLPERRLHFRYPWRPDGRWCIYVPYIHL